MRKTGKSIAALFVALMVVLTLMVPAFAASTITQGATISAPTANSTATVNVATGNAGDTLYLYQVIDANFDPASNNLTMDYTQLFKDFLTATSTTLSLDSYDALASDSAALKDILGAFTAYVKGLTPAPTAAKQATTDGSGKAVFSNVEMGQYIVIGGGNTTGALIYQTVTAEVVPHIDANNEYKIASSYDVEMKVSTPAIEKEVQGTAQDGDKETASIGDIVEYTLTIAVPTYPAGATNKTFFIGDTLSNGLRLNADSIVVKGVAGANETTLAVPAAYTTNTAGATNNGGTFYVDFKFAEIAAYTNVVVTYTATITDQVALGTTGTGNPNDVTLVYSNTPFNGNTWVPSGDPEDPDRPETSDPGYGSDDDTKTVYSYALVIDKYDSNETTKKLSKAVFEVYYGSEAPANLVATITTGEAALQTSAA
ncbi:MAG: isopeptide-forming domain-containing fimbrial protein [Oscillospiraceae bacterium]|jgi:fimbrial isopeptide formation D2 family protein|nr:isopeptide-forming domain-containing fimbrial protein [Oscillospiraceae bacterium]